MRGNTSQQIVMMAREAGARKVFFASAAPPVRFPNVYGIDMPTRAELLATGRNDEQIRREIGADALIYQDLEELEAAVREANPEIQKFDSSCFNGQYITGDVTPEYLDRLEHQRDGEDEDSTGSSRQLDLNLRSA